MERVIKAIHGEDGKMVADSKVGLQVHLRTFLHVRMENIEDKKDLWHGDMVLKQRYPRLYALEVKKNVDVASKLSPENLTWSFRRAPITKWRQD
ncbi:hypothetical protein Tco_0749719 [Tanacetum coccineum]|uniref:Uncharacterized protein n=1 Tax=Tanacetum coccineum TaxID=301880 RepID=A0ABQ4Z294_9ASTR